MKILRNRPEMFFLLAFMMAGIASVAVPGLAGENKALLPMLIKGKKVLIEVVRTEREKEKGLMFREKLGADEGMLFVYEKEGILSFWMKNTRIPLSIAFIDRKGKIVDIQDMEPFSLKGHLSRYPAQYALEMNQGWFQRNGIQVGETVKLPEPDKKSGSKP
jgi:uncharacterized protein